MSTPPHLTDIATDGWELDDGEVANRENPNSYWIPTFDERSSLRAGDLVKIRFYILTDDGSGKIANGERMWVRVSSRLEGWYEGILDNDSASSTDVAAGMRLWFEPRHVIDIRRANA